MQCEIDSSLTTARRHTEEMSSSFVISRPAFSTRKRRNSKLLGRSGTGRSAGSSRHPRLRSRQYRTKSYCTAVPRATTKSTRQSCDGRGQVSRFLQRNFKTRSGRGVLVDVKLGDRRRQPHERVQKEP